jgi:hypothetical protein
MKKTTILSALVAASLALVSFHLKAQDIPDKRNIWTGGQQYYVVNGNLEAIKNAKSLDVTVIPKIEKMGVREEPDDIYVARRISEWNAEKAGTGDYWLQEWEEAKKNFRPSFIEGLDSRLSKSGIIIGKEGVTAEYSFVIYTKFMLEFNDKIFIMLDVDVVERAYSGNIIAHIRCPVINSVLMSKQISVTTEHAYYNAGRMLGKYLLKSIYE